MSKDKAKETKVSVGSQTLGVFHLWKMAGGGAWYGAYFLLRSFLLLPTLCNGRPSDDQRLFHIDKHNVVAGALTASAQMLLPDFLEIRVDMMPVSRWTLATRSNSHTLYMLLMIYCMLDTLYEGGQCSRSGTRANSCGPYARDIEDILH